jgi:hypothetical protein
MEKTGKIFQEYRRQILPDTLCNSFEGDAHGLAALMEQIKKNGRSDSKLPAIWEICLVDWSRMFRLYIN